MGIISGILLILGGTFMTLIGFRLINVFKGLNDAEKVENWYKKYGLLMKIGGIFALIIGLVNILL
jgi:hypothetical protein